MIVDPLPKTFPVCPKKTESECHLSTVSCSWDCPGFFPAIPGTELNIQCTLLLLPCFVCRALKIFPHMKSGKCRVNYVRISSGVAQSHIICTSCNSRPFYRKFLSTQFMLVSYSKAQKTDYDHSLAVSYLDYHS